MSSRITNKSDTDEIRERVLLGLAGNRSPGFHFPGYFLQLAWPRIGGDSIDETMPVGPHCRNADGDINLAALGMMLDTALATAPRLRLYGIGYILTIFCWREIVPSAVEGTPVVKPLD